MELPNSPISSPEPDTNGDVQNRQDDSMAASKPSFWLVRMWQTKRWLTIALGLGVLIALLAVAMVIVISLDATTKTSPAPTPTPVATSPNEPQATKSTEDDQFFAAQPLTMLYYSFSQTSNAKNIFQATPSDRESRKVAIGFPSTYSFASSPNSRWLLRWDEKIVSRSSASEPQDFSTIFEVNESSRIVSVQWQADSSSIAILTSDTSSDTDGITSAITLLPLLTLQPVEVYKETSAHQYALFAYPTATELYVARNTNGSLSHLTMYNPRSKKIVKEVSGFNNGKLATSQFTRDMKWAYRITETELLRTNLQNYQQEVLYKVSRDCTHGQPNSSHLTGFSVAPSGKSVLVHEKRVACRITSENDSGSQVDSKTMMISTSDAKIIASKNNLEISSISASHWSPEESFIWLTISNDRSVTMVAKDLTMNPVPPESRNALTKERVFFIGWLKAQK